MKVFVFVAALLCFSMVAHAQCVAARDTVMWTDVNKMYAFMEAYTKSVVIGENMMNNDIATGAAIKVPGGSKLDEVQIIDEFLSIVWIGMVKMMGFNKFIRCR